MMRKSLPTRALREHPDLNQLKRQAKELLADFIAGLPGAVTEVNTHYCDADAGVFTLHHAQLVIGVPSVVRDRPPRRFIDSPFEFKTDFHQSRRFPRHVFSQAASS
jgi:hypothetical protein